MRIRYTVLLLLIFTSLLIPQTGQIIDGIAAIVGDKIILRSEVEQLAMMNAQRLNINPYSNTKEYQKLMKQNLETLIDQYIILEQAKVESIVVKERDIDRALQGQIESMISQVGSEDKVEEIMGMPISKIKRTYRENIHDQLVVETFQQQKFGSVTASRREVEAFYSEYRDSIPDIDPSADIKHILITVKSGSESDKEAFQKISEIQERINNGEDFAELARMYSEDPGSKDSGGELGYIKRGYLVKEFEEVAFSLQPGEISDILKTEFGYHIIQSLDRRGDKINVRHILIVPKTTKKDEQKVVNKLDSIKQQIIDKKTSFEQMAIKYSDDQDVANNRGHITINLDKPSVPELVPVIRSLSPGEISKPVRSELGYHIIQLKKINPGGKPNPEENWTVIENFALQKKRMEKYNEWIKRLREEFYIKRFM